jgi:lysozyme family protein
MTADRFATCLAFVLAREGGFSNNPNDSGGATMKGVTQRVYDAYRQRKGLALRTVALIEDAELQDIYRTGYWTPTCCDQLPAGVDLCVFDLAVNAGDDRSERILQQALGVTVDGQVGPKTIAAARAADPRALANRLLDLRATFYRQLCIAEPKDAVFLDGWLNRVALLRKLI